MRTKIISYNKISFKKLYEKQKTRKCNQKLIYKGLDWGILRERCWVCFFFLSWENVYSNCFPHSVVDRATTAYVFGTESITLVSTLQSTGEIQGTKRTCRCHLEYGSVLSQPVFRCSLPYCILLNRTPALEGFIIRFCYKEFRNYFLLHKWYSCYLSFLFQMKALGEKKKVKIGKGYGSSDLGKQAARVKIVPTKWITQSEVVD